MCFASDVCRVKQLTPPFLTPSITHLNPPHAHSCPSPQPPPLDADDIELLKAYGVGPYTRAIKDAEDMIKKHQDTVKQLIGIKESDTGLR